MDVYLDSESVFTFQTDYTKIDGIYVPERSIFKIGVKGISKWSARNPVDLGGPGSERQDFEDIAKNAGFDPEKDEFVGEMVMAFTKYKVNEGIDNQIFEEKVKTNINYEVDADIINPKFIKEKINKDYLEVLAKKAKFISKCFNMTQSFFFCKFMN